MRLPRRCHSIYARARHHHFLLSVFPPPVWLLLGPSLGWQKNRRTDSTTLRSIPTRHCVQTCKPEREERARGFLGRQEEDASLLPCRGKVRVTLPLLLLTTLAPRVVLRRGRVEPGGYGAHQFLLRISRARSFPPLRTGIIKLPRSEVMRRAASIPLVFELHWVKDAWCPGCKVQVTT